MKRKKAVLAAVLIIFLALGWIFSLRNVTGMESREKQQELTEKADEYAEKELWVRAIPLYEEALQYKTGNNVGIESRLLNAYYQYGDMDSYNDLVEKRAAENTAAKQEYINTSDSYIAGYNLEKGMELVKRGIDQMGDQDLIDYYEANRYAYSVNVTKYEEIIPTEENTFMPARGEGGWCYVDENGREILERSYETASGFNIDGFAAVKKDGKYYTILQNGDKYGVDETGITDVYGMSGNHILAKVNGKYSYYDYDFNCVAPAHQYEEITANSCGVAAVKKGSMWGIITDSGETVVDFTLDDVAVNSLGAVFADGKAMVRTGENWYLINTDGERLCESGFTEAKAPEASGYIAVGNGEKWGFIDETGKIVIDYQYEDAFSFSEGLGAVRIGAKWNYISEKNVRVIDQEFAEAKPFHNKIAQAKITGKAALIELEYVEK